MSHHTFAPRSQSFTTLLGLVLMSHPSAVVGWVGLGGLVSQARLRVTLLICPMTTTPCRFNKWNILHTFGQFVQTQMWHLATIPIAIFGMYCSIHNLSQLCLSTLEWSLKFYQFPQNSDAASGYHYRSSLLCMLQRSQLLSAASVGSGAVAEVLPVPAGQWGRVDLATG